MQAADQVLPGEELRGRQPAPRSGAAPRSVAHKTLEHPHLGHRACQGCGEALGARYALDAAMRATEGRLIAANATGCLEEPATPYPESSWQLPWIHSLFGNAPAVATGIAAALKVKGRTDVRVVGQGGDGGTVDIGFACLSEMFERNDDVLYVCYDNEAYMNRCAALGRDAAGSSHRDDQAGQGRERQRVRPEQNTPIRHGARDPMRYDGDRRRAARPRGHGRAADGAPTAPLPARLRAVSARMGALRPPTRSRSPALRRRRACSPSSRLSTATWSACRRSVAACRWRSTCGCGGGSRICSATRRAPT